MLGNDVVDLGDAETAVASLHPRFDARVFDAAERSWLRGENELSRVWRWRFWAAKEAAFKVAKRNLASTIWSPKRFSVEPTGDGARVHHDGHEYRVDWRETDDWVHAIAWRTDDAPARLIADVAARHEAAASLAVRDFACAEVGRVLDGSAGPLRVRTENRIPCLDVEIVDVGEDVAAVSGVSASFPLSLAHHGRFVAFACALPSRSSDCEAAA